MADTVIWTVRPSVDEPERWDGTTGWARPVAWIAGLLGAVLAVALPFLPVEMESASVTWPEAGTADSVEAPLTAYAPAGLSAHLPCAAFTALAESGGVAVSTVPRQSPDMERYGFVAKVVADTVDRPGRVDIVSRNTLLWSAPLETVRGQGCSVGVEMSSARTVVSVDGTTVAGATVEADMRPQVVGVFSELTDTVPGDMRVDIDVDSRFSTSPTPLKLAVIVACLLATAVALVALHRLDGTDGRWTRRFLPARWWRLRPTDRVVFTTLLVWHFIGANTSDDGYILGMARDARNSGYMSNYYRWFSVDEGPFYTPYTDVISWLTHVSTASPWVRLPTLLVAVLTWWVVSREVLPRLGRAVHNDKVVVWTAALVFLAFWLPYNNGLRAEPFVALGVVLTWVSVERALATRRLLPAAMAIIVAAFTLTVAPSGLICAGALLAGARGLVEILVRRARTVGYLPLLLPGLAAGLVVLAVVFADRTLAAVLEMVRVHGRIGPGEPWFFEFLRYQYLLQLNADGWLTRRFGMFVMLLGLLVCVVTMLRRGGHIPGTAVGPSRRVIGITVAAMALMMFSPTKWTHQFGVFVGLGTCVAALTAVAVGPRVMRPLRNRALFAAAVFFALAMTFVGANGYWYVSSWGVPWWDKPPTLAGTGLSTVAAAATVFALAVAAWFHIRPETRPRRAHQLPARIPILVVASAVMVLFVVLSFVKAALAQYPAYSLTKSNVAAAFSGGCGLADDVLVETDPNASMLRPLSGDIATALAGTEPTGFDPNGVASVLASDEVETTTGRANSVSDNPDELRDAARSAGSQSDTSRGTGVNGGSVALPFGLDPASTPILGSYQDGDQTPAALTTGWYGLPDTSTGERGKIIAIAVAGRIRSVDSDGIEHYGQSLELEYGRTRPDGSVQALGRALPIDIGPSPMWRNLRVPLDRLSGDADAVRLVADDRDLNQDQWLAVTPPRVPRTTTLNDLVGSRTPVLLDWAVGLNFPCQNHLPTRAGVSQLPEYRILPDRNGATITNLWQGHDGGGPLGWTQLLFTARTLPAYLNDDWDRDWGSVERFIPLDRDARPARISLDPVRRGGMWSPGHIITAY
ncbi:arabinosyltransferase domain-containing protein [Nocardia brevicatena]|uniref:arabinosyltransferase domain-containing protein n=1 Tax=Nocardia brevicatena TaxID=37327 RepID=UPI00059397D5|nr:arabinosyltransferase domain-containing protein [Nocardia brevicatena]